MIEGEVEQATLLVGRVMPEADRSLPGAFRQSARRHGARTALVSATWRPTYEELDASSNRLANAIIARGGAPGDRVAILMQHDAPAIAALLAVMKSGRTVVVLNAIDPPLRLRQLVEDAEPALIVTDAFNRQLAAEIAAPGCAVVDFAEAQAFRVYDDPPVDIAPEQVAALIYTSGSTGSPKAVMATHRQYLRNAIMHGRALDYTSADRLPLFGALSGGQGMTMTWSALVHGATLHPFPVTTKGVTGLADWIGDNGINVYISSASIFRNFLKTVADDVVFSGVRAVRLASESTTVDDFRLFEKHFPDDCVFVHGLSCTETGNIAMGRHLRGAPLPGRRFAVGHISDGIDVLLLGEDGREVGAGEVGEIAVRGRYVAAGYWRNPTLTAERFSADLDGNGTRLVRTGDLGRFNAQDMLEFVGRTDDRVKVRGNRIELGEIEQALHRLPGVARAVVEAIGQPHREPTLVGFVVGRDGEAPSAAGLRRALRAMLPRHMVPSNFVLLDAFPFTPTGKIDREALRRRQVRSQRDAEADERSLTETEQMLADIWADAFEVSRVDRQADFFELGGDSLVAAVVAARVHAATEVELDLGTFADYPTLNAMAALIDQRRSRSADDHSEPLVRASRAEPIPISFSQQRAWQTSQTTEGMGPYTHTDRYRIDGPLDREALRESFDFLFRRHEILRTTFPSVAGVPSQRIHDPEPVALPFADLAGLPHDDSDIERAFRTLSTLPRSLTDFPLMRFALIRVSDTEHWLQRINHHILTDAWSGQLLFRELGDLYAAMLRGDLPPLSDAPPLQFADYAVWERKALRRGSPLFAQTLEWWKRHLANPAPVVRLPFRRSTSLAARWWRALQPPPVPADGVVNWAFDREVSRRLDRLGRSAGATFFVVRLAAYVALLASQTGRHDLLIGTYVANRNRLPLQAVHGLFATVLALRFRYRPDATFREWLGSVRHVMVDAERHSMLPFETLCAELEREGIGRPAIEAIFWISQNDRGYDLADARMTKVNSVMNGMPWGFSFNPEERVEGGCRALFDARIYDPAGVRAFAQRYSRLLNAASQAAERPLRDLLAQSH